METTVETEFTCTGSVPETHNGAEPEFLETHTTGDTGSHHMIGQEDISTHTQAMKKVNTILAMMPHSIQYIS